MSLVLLLIIWYKEYTFDKSPLNPTTKQKIVSKEKRIIFLIKKYYGIDFDVPVKVSKKLEDKKFGLTYYYNGRITIYLNKNHFFENEKYMIEDVLPHEYAHALMFKLGNFSDIKDGHSKKWQNICKQLEGKKCTRYVNLDDIIMGKSEIFE